MMLSVKLLLPVVFTMFLPLTAVLKRILAVLPANIEHETSNVTLSLHRALRPLQNISVKMDIQLGLEQKQQLLQLHVSKLV